MSDQNGFFRFIWRANALLILVVMLLAGVWLGGLLWADFSARSDAAGKAAEWKKLTAPQSRFTLSEFDAWAEIDLSASVDIEHIFVLRETQSIPLYGKKDEEVARNILAVNYKKGSSRWLFPPNVKVIGDLRGVQYAPENRDGMPKMSPHGIAIVVAEADTNKDGKIDENDRQSLYFYARDGLRPTKIVSADRIQLEVRPWQGQTLHFFYQEDEKTYAASLTLPDCVHIAKVPVPALPKLSGPTPSPIKVGFITEPQSVD